MDIDKPTGGGALDGSAHTETLAELLAVGEKAPVISRSESLAPVTSTKIEWGECSSSLDGYAGDVDEDEKKSHMYNNKVGQSDGHDEDVDDDDDGDDDSSSGSCSNNINARPAKAKYLQKRCLIRYNVFVTRQEAERLKYDSGETVCYDTGLPRSIKVIIIERQMK